MREFGHQGCAFLFWFIEHGGPRVMIQLQQLHTWHSWNFPVTKGTPQQRPKSQATVLWPASGPRREWMIVTPLCRHTQVPTCT